MEGIGKRYTFLMKVLGKMYIRERAGQQEYFLTGDSKAKEIFSDGRERNLWYTFLAKEKYNLL